MIVSENDKIWQEYGKQSRKHINDKNYGLYRNCRYDMAMFLKKEGKYENELALLAEVCFWDLNGCDNRFEYQSFLEITMGYLFPYDKSTMKLMGRIFKEVAICQSKLGYTDEQLKSEMLNSLKSMTAPVQFFTYSEIVDIFILERDRNAESMKNNKAGVIKNEATLKKIYATAKKRFNPKHPNLLSNMKKEY